MGWSRPRIDEPLHFGDGRGDWTCIDNDQIRGGGGQKERFTSDCIFMSRPVERYESHGCLWENLLEHPGERSVRNDRGRRLEQAAERAGGQTHRWMLQSNPFTTGTSSVTTTDIRAECQIHNCPTVRSLRCHSDDPMHGTNSYPPENRPKTTRCRRRRCEPSNQRTETIGTEAHRSPRGMINS